MKRRGRKPRQVVNPEPVPVDDNEEEEDTIEVGVVRGDVNIFHSRMTKTCWKTLLTCL